MVEKYQKDGCRPWCGGGGWLGKSMGKASVTEHSFWDSPLLMLMPVVLCCLCWVVIHCMNIPQIVYQDFWWTLWLLRLVLLWVNYYETSSTDTIMGQLEATHSQPPLLLTRAGWMRSWYHLSLSYPFLHMLRLNLGSLPAHSTPRSSLTQSRLPECKSTLWQWTSVHLCYFRSPEPRVCSLVTLIRRLRPR